MPALTWVTKNLNGDQLIVWGHSMGAAIAILTGCLIILS